MSAASDSAESAFGPWNPGIRSPLPRDLLPLATIFRPENVFTALRDAEELHDLTGLELADIVAFRPERLALHELLVRITADLSVPDGARIEDLGINFREMTGVIFGRYIEPRMPAIIAAYDALRKDIAAHIAREVDPVFMPTAAPAQNDRTTGWRGWFARRRQLPVERGGETDRGAQMIERWRHAGDTAEDAVRRAACFALAKVASA